MALSIAMGVAGIGLSLASRMPISAAWSTPGAALLAATGAAAGGFPVAVGAFLAVGLLIIAAGLFKPFGRMVAAIPGPIANAMLAGVLFGLCLAPIRALVEAPVGAGLIVVSWLVVSRWKRVYATPIAALVAGLVIAASGQAGGFNLATLTPRPIFVAPEFSLEAVIGLAAPLFIVTMASQNLPGLAVLGAYGYRPNPGPLVAATGLFTLVAAPFGGHAVNLSAITAALCASPDASPDPGHAMDRRRRGRRDLHRVRPAGGRRHGVRGRRADPRRGCGGTGAAQRVRLRPPQCARRHPGAGAALAAFLVTASGISIYGVGGAFWGLIVGGMVLFLTRAGASMSSRQAP